MYRRLFLAVLACCISTQALGQAVPQGRVGSGSRYALALGYNNIRANAPPTLCGCFDMSGGFASVSVPVFGWLGAAAEVTGGHANSIGPLGQNLSLLTYTAGPQVAWRASRFVPYAQALFGAAHGSDSYFPDAAGYTTSATSFAYSLGGGVDVGLTDRWAVRALEAQFLHTGFPNGGNNEQRHLMLGAGIVYRLR